MRKIFIYKDGEKNYVFDFLVSADSKLQNKLKLMTDYISDEKNVLCEPYVKHFSTGRYRQLYELRIKVSAVMARIIFYKHNGEIIFLHAFYKHDNRDTGYALEYAFKIFKKITKENDTAAEQSKEHFINCSAVFAQI